MLGKAKSYHVLKKDKKVLLIKDAPGRIVSTGYFPDHPPPEHPFLDAEAIDPFEEDRLGTLIRASKSFDDFVSRLKKDGYKVVEIAD